MVAVHPSALKPRVQLANASGGAYAKGNTTPKQHARFKKHLPADGRWVLEVFSTTIQLHTAY